MVWTCPELWMRWFGPVWSFRWFGPVRNFGGLNLSGASHLFFNPSGPLWVWHSGLELMILSLDGKDPRASVILGWKKGRVCFAEKPFFFFGLMRSCKDDFRLNSFVWKI